jgi:hypothetical protein
MLDPNFCTHWRFINGTKMVETNPLGNQHFAISMLPHDLTKAQTSCINHKEAPWGDHTPLHFVTMCDNGVFNGGIFAPLNIFPCPICRYKATLMYFLAPYISL